MERRKNNSLIIGFALGLAILASSQPAAAQQYEFKVEHRHVLRNCRGTLIIGRDQIEYQTKHTKDARVWRYEDIKRIEVVSPRAIHLVTYEDQGKFLKTDRTFEFKLLAGSITQQVNDFLLLRVKRPLVTSLIPEMSGPPMFEVPAKHRHRIGGCEGILRIYPHAIVFESRQPKHSRYWRYSDVQQIGRLGPYRFEITTFEGQVGGPERVFDFDLKQRLDDVAYDYLWVRVNKTKYYPYGPEHTEVPAPPEKSVQTSRSKGENQL